MRLIFRAGGKSLQFSTLAVFVCFGALYALVQSSASWNDPDGFYHARMIDFLGKGELVRHFRWLPHTVLEQHFSNQHLLYHLLVVPLSWVWPVPVAMKIFAATTAAAAVAALYAVLRRVGAPVPLLWALCFGLSALVAYRLNLPKSDALAVLLQLGVIAAWWWTGRARPVLLVALGWIYGLTHGSWPMAMLIALLATGARVATAPAGQGRAALRREAPALGATAVGLAAGMVLNPYFPANGQWAWYQIVEIAVLGGNAGVQAGAEWYPLPWSLLISGCAPLLVAVGAGLALTWQAHTSRRIDWCTREGWLALFFGLCAGLTWAMTLRSGRHVVYGSLYLALFGGALWRLLAVQAPVCLEQTRAWMGVHRWPTRLLATALAAALLYNPVLLWQSRHGTPWNYLQRAAAYLESHSRPGELVYNCSFDVFPKLFYWNAHNHYLSGLDPRFFYQRHPQAALAYEKPEPSLAQLVNLMDRFGARYVLIELDGPRPMKHLQSALRANSRQVRLVYQDSEALIYERAGSAQQPRPPAL
ncbi:hypothetical protein [Gloeobacter morelensis]|uniref:Glycosyltransferase RgtA/B/C/D-like domain-containing protein n=1 Tax=Gloeobacter morelensis MG652769 TaxID=2781736 RepID=A0ABY3PG19_9CYAN|nr:hypothetical protein [Gloeobacter morelensis]UFP92602.1 hypothetical protein ISF26_12175 [Gloeobacter morelensis MG652769]